MGGYIGANSGTLLSNAAERKQTYSITTATTSLTGLAYTPTKVHVFHNGVRLVDGTDYTATNGTSITLTNAAQNGDEVVVISYPSFQTSDTVSAANGGTFAGNVAMSGTLGVTGATTLSSTLGVTGKITSTAGITFGSDTAAVNVLDDYEEGTWTPVLKATTTDPTVGGYHSNTGGRYTKIGNRVFVNFFMQTTSITSNGSGTLQIGGLPYTNIVLPGASEGSGMFINYYVNTNLSAGRVLQGYVRNGQTNMLLIENGKGDDTGSYAAGTPAGDFGLYAMAMYHTH